MKYIRWLVILVILLTQMVVVTAQDATPEPNYSLNLRECAPRFWLPDTEESVQNLGDPNYRNEQLVELCLTVRDQFNRIQSDPQISGNGTGGVPVISATRTDGSAVSVLATFAPRLPGDFNYEIMLLLDASYSMTNSIRPMQEAARNAIRNSGLPNPYVAVYSFSNTANLEWRLTQDDQLIESAINAVEANPSSNSSTCLYDAINTALQTTPVNQHARRVIILFTDGRNSDQGGNCQVNEPEDVIANANSRGVSIYGIGMQGNQGFDPDQLTRLTDETNGSTVIGNREALPGLFESIFTNLSSLRVIRSLICGSGEVTLTVQATIGDQVALPASNIVNLSNTECLAPTPVPEITPTSTPAFPDLVVRFARFDVLPDAQARDFATIVMEVNDRPDIASIEVQITDSISRNAPPTPATCDQLDRTRYQCMINVSELEIGEITAKVTVLDANNNAINPQPIQEPSQRRNLRPILTISPQDDDLLINIDYSQVSNDASFSIPLATSADFSVRDAAGVEMPLAAVGSGNGPYRLSLASLDSESITIIARLSFGTSADINTLTVASEPLSVRRSLGQQIARFLQGNVVLVIAVLALGVGGIGWMFWGKRQGPASREDEWLRNSVPEATRAYGKSEAALPAETEAEATRIYSKTAPMGDLELVNLTTDPTRVGSRVSVNLPFIIGRDKNCQLTITDDFLSRRHLSITQQDAMPYLTDLGSSNGTILDGKPLTANTPVLLKHRAEIVLGAGVKLRFHLPEEMATRMVSVSPKSST